MKYCNFITDRTINESAYHILSDRNDGIINYCTNSKRDEYNTLLAAQNLLIICNTDFYAYLEYLMSAHHDYKEGFTIYFIL